MGLGCGSDTTSPDHSVDSAAGPRAATTQYPIVFVLLSGLRPDMVGALGGSGGWTPNIDAFAQEADWVGTSVVASSTPVVSLTSLMAGVSPWHHQILDQLQSRPRGDLPLLAQALTDLGYRTEARIPVEYRLHRFGLLEGFETTAPIEPIADTAGDLRLLTDQPVLYWLHLLEASAPYKRRDEQIPRLAALSEGLPNKITARSLWPYADPAVPLPARQRRELRQLFSHEVAWADLQVGEILEAVRASTSWDKAWIILTATQGTELGDHGQVLFSQNLKRASIEVPLLIKLPQGLKDSRLRVSPEHRVEQRRLWTTLVEAAGGEVGPIHAPSLFRVGPLPIVSELYSRNGVNQFSFLKGETQLIWSKRFAPPEPEYFRAQFARSGGRVALSEAPHRLFRRMTADFRRARPFSGSADDEPPELNLERWTENGVEEVEDAELAEELAGELWLQLRRFVEEERAPGEESTLSRPAR